MIKTITDNTTHTLKLQKSVEAFLTPIPLRECLIQNIERYRNRMYYNHEGLIKVLRYAKRKYYSSNQTSVRFRRNLNTIPDFLDNKEAALFMYLLITYWGEQGEEPVLNQSWGCSHLDCWDRTSKIIDFGGNSSYESVWAEKFVIRLFGKQFERLPFVSTNSSGYHVITTDALREFAYS